MALKIKDKFLLAVTVPVVFELVLVGALTYLLAQAEEARMKASNARELASRINSVMGLAMQRSSLMALSHLTHSRTSAYQKAQVIENQIRTELGIINSLAQTNPETRPKCKEFAELVAQIDDSLTKARAKLDEGDRVTTTMLWLEGQKKVDQLLAVADEMCRVQEDTRARREAQGNLYNSQVELILMLLVLTSIFLAFGLATYFNHGTANRLRVIMENTRRLAQNEHLQEPLRGRDELAEVDRAYHSMYEERRKIEEMRREFVAMVSHDLRTPLTSIQMVHSMLEQEEGESLSDTGRRSLEIAQDNINRLMALINNLLDLDRLEAGELALFETEISVADLINVSTSSLNALAKQRKLVFKSNVPPDTMACADKERIIQVLINLLSNAIKFSPTDSEITIQVHKTSDLVKISISDKGRGIPEAKRNEIFARFKQVSKDDQRLHKGTGLGLAICKAIITQHGGEIGVESVEGVGSTFWFTLPANAETFKARTEAVKSGVS